MNIPDYHGGSIVNLMASLQSGLGGKPHAYAPLRGLSAERIAGHRQVLLLVIDGLGLNYLCAHPEAQCMNAHLADRMTSVFPPTTATAITSYLTGDAPQQHGLTGWHMYFRELGSVLSVLPGKARYGRVGLSDSGVDAARLLDHQGFSTRISHNAYTVAPSRIAQSDFNRAHLGRSKLLSYERLTEMIDQVAGVLRNGGQNFVYAYWPELDALGHKHGIHSVAAVEHLMLLDKAFASLLDRIKGTDTLVLLSADHGQIDTTAADRICLDHHPEVQNMLVLPLCGESRAAYCYLRPGCGQDFEDYVLEHWSEQMDMYYAAEILEAGWFGLGAPHPGLAQRIGDRILVMRDHYVLKDWLAQEPRFDLVGVHGGLSADELYVPLVVAEV